MSIRLIMRALLVVVLLLGAGAISREIVEVRMVDLDYLLTHASKESGRSDAAGLLGQYELIRRRLLSGEGPLDQYELEARVAAISSMTQFDDGMNSNSDVVPSRPARAVVRTIRVTLGKDPTARERESAFLPRLDQAYFFERLRRYETAAEVYSSLLAEPELPASFRPTIEMHRAFCISMTGAED
ncbi:MAG: hypothetical protein GVY23_02910, partial [Spirochaetes bacterium]|nr:hypothetical protein [Spirochaetota bacterium]